jgi:hypothetical protein
MIYNIFVTVSAIFGAFILYIVQQFFQHCWSLRKFNGPLAIPFVGNCYQAEALYFFRYLAKLRKRYGRVFTFFALTKPYLVVCEPVVVRRVLSDTKTFIKGKDYSDVFGYAFGEGLVTSNGQKHKDDRSCFGKYFVRGNISKYMPVMNKLVEEAIATLLPSKTGSPGGDYLILFCFILFYIQNVLNFLMSPFFISIFRGEIYLGAVQNMEQFFALLSLRVFMEFSISFVFGCKRLEREKEVICFSFSIFTFYFCSNSKMFYVYVLN